MFTLHRSLEGLNSTLSSLLRLVLHKLIFILCLLVGLPIVYIGAQNPLAPAGSFNVFLQGNATLESNESEGAIAIGGNLTVKGYQLLVTPSNTNGASPFQVGGVTVGLVVGGGVKLVQGELKILNNGYLKIGNCLATGNASIDPLKVWYKDANNAVSNIRITTQGSSYNSPSPAYISLTSSFSGLGVDTISNPVCQANVIDFGNAFTQLKTNSQNLTLCQNNIETWTLQGKVTDINGTNLILKDEAGATGPRIWNVTGAALNSINNLNLDFTPSASRPLIINVTTGADFTWQVKNQNVNGAMNYILWNFPAVTGTLVIGGSATVEGSILAPYASVDKETGGNNSNIEGQLIAQNYVMASGEMHIYPFLGSVPSCGNVVCVKPNAGKDTTVCSTSIQLTTAAQGQTWSFLSSSNNNTPTVSSAGLVTGLTVSGTYRFILKKEADASCSDTVTVTKANFVVANLPDYDICPGQTLTFGYQGLSNVTYKWSNNTTSATISVSPLQTTTYSVVVTSNATGCKIADTVQVVVLPKPNAGKDTVVCTTDAKIKGAGNGESWSFLSFNDPNNPSNTDAATIDAQGNIASLDKNGFYRFVLTNSSGCKDTIRVQKTSVTIPQIQLNPICPGTELNFGFTNTTDFTYLWSTGATTPKITVKPDTTTDYYVTVTNIQNQCQATDTVTVVVKPAPKLVLVSSVCSQDNSKYITTVTVSNGTVVTANAGIVTGSGTTFTVTVGKDTTQYSITATLDGCLKRLTVNKPDCSCPQIISPTTTSASRCGLGTVTLTASGCTTGTTATWYGDIALTTQLGTGNSFVTPSLSQNKTYYVACVSNSQSICRSTPVQATATIKPLPTFSGISTNCVVQSSTYNVTIASTGLVTVVSPSGTNISGSNPYTISNIPAGQNLVLNSNLNGCAVDTTIIAPNCSCTPSIPSALASSVSICEGSNIPNPTFTAVVNPNTTIDWYSASSNGTLLQANSLTFTAPSVGTYYMQAKSTVQGCNGEVNPTRVPVTLSIISKPSYLVQVQTPECENGQPKNNGKVSISTGNVDGRYAFNTTGFGTLPTDAAAATAIGTLPLVLAQNIANNTPTLSYYIRVFGESGCFKDTTVTISASPCNSLCPTIATTDARDTLCSGSYGEAMVVNVSDTSQTIRFVYFTTPQTGNSMYSGGILLEEVKPTNGVASIPNGLPGLVLPSNSGTVPVNYYVYAILKNLPTSVPNCAPYAEKIYTILPLPQFSLDSILACTGDTTYRVNLRISGAGLFEVVVATGFSSIGNGPVPTGIKQTLTNVGGNNQLTVLNLSTSGGHVIFVKNANSCASILPAPAPSFQNCEGDYDLALDKSINKKVAKIGDALTYTIKVWNEGASTATNIVVRDTLNAGVEYVTYATATGNYDFNSKQWTIGSLAPGDTATLQLVVKVVRQGVWFNTAEICSMTQKDKDSTPCNGEEEEDDIDYECFTVPMEVCAGEVIEARLPEFYKNVKWFKNQGTEVVATGNVFLITEPGIYTFETTNNICPTQGCCAIIVEPSANCCPTDVCIPMTIKKIKKGGVTLK